MGEICAGATECRVWTLAAAPGLQDWVGVWGMLLHASHTQPQGTWSYAKCHNIKCIISYVLWQERL